MNESTTGILPKVSVIIPVYNVADYLPIAVESLQAQSFPDFEVILIEDRSTDDGATLREAQRQAAMDSRIKVVRTEVNSGAGIARNVGLDIARGEYITFLDADDQLSTDALRNLLQLAHRYNADIVCCTMESLLPSGKVLNHVEGAVEQVFTDPTDIMELALNVFSESVGKGRRVFHMPTISRLIRRSLLDDNGIRFPNVRHMLSEDLHFAFQSMRKAKVFVYTDDSYYRYLQRPGSTTHNPRPDMIEKAVKSSVYYLSTLRADNELPPYAVDNVRGFVLTWLRTSLKQMFTSSSMSMKEKRAWMREQAENPFFRTIYEEFPWRDMPLKHRLGFISFYKKRFTTLYTLVVWQEKMRRLLGKV